MQDPDRRGRRARCAGLILGRRVHEWSWNAPVLIFYGGRVPWPVVGDADVVVFAKSVTILLTP
jgi:hypothetical protein